MCDAEKDNYPPQYFYENNPALMEIRLTAKNIPKYWPKTEIHSVKLLPYKIRAEPRNEWVQPLRWARQGVDWSIDVKPDEPNLREHATGCL